MSLDWTPRTPEQEETVDQPIFEYRSTVQRNGYPLGESTDVFEKRIDLSTVETSDSSRRRIVWTGQGFRAFIKRLCAVRIRVLLRRSS